MWEKLELIQGVSEINVRSKKEMEDIKINNFH